MHDPEPSEQATFEKVGSDHSAVFMTETRLEK